MKKLLCPYCNEICDLDTTESTNECPHCHKQIETSLALKNTQIYLSKIYKSAIQYYDNAYSYEEAYKCYDEFLKFEPASLDAILGKLISRVKCSTLKNNYFNEIIEEFDKSDIILEKVTYIRIGHFFEELINATFHYQNALLEFIKHAEPKELEIAYYDVVTLLGFYKFIFENITLFTDEEYSESIFVSKDEVNLNKEKLINFIRESKAITFEMKELSSAEIFINNKRFKAMEFDIKNYEDVQDFAFFKVMDYGVKQSYIIFALLIIFTIAMSVGFILSFTLGGDKQWIGLTITGVFAAADVITYFVYSKIRNKQMAQLNK